MIISLLWSLFHTLQIGIYSSQCAHETWHNATNIVIVNALNLIGFEQRIELELSLQLPD